MRWIYFLKTFNFYGFFKSAGTCKINIPQKWLFSTLITITIIIIVRIYPHWPPIKIISLCVLRPLHQRSTPFSPLCKLPRKFLYDVSMTWISFSFSPDFTPWQQKKKAFRFPTFYGYHFIWIRVVSLRVLIISTARDWVWVNHGSPVRYTMTLGNWNGLSNLTKSIPQPFPPLPSNFEKPR